MHYPIAIEPGNQSTAIIALGARRVSWREVVRDAQ